MDKVLHLLKSWESPDKLSLKLLTLKTVALMALSSSDRGQTLHLTNIASINFHEDRTEFVIKDKTKTTKKFQKPLLITCVSTCDPSSDVNAHVRSYLEKLKISEVLRTLSSFFLGKLK